MEGKNLRPKLERHRPTHNHNNTKDVNIETRHLHLLCALLVFDNNTIY